MQKINKKRIIMDKIQILNKALNQYGIKAQEWMLVEECGELLNAIAKLKRKRSTKEDIITELADVSIVVEQMALFFGWEDFEAEKQRKLARLENRLEKGGEQV